MYAYPVHSSVPAPRTAARASWKSAVSGCLARGLKAHPIVTGTAVLALSGAVLVGGVTLAVLAVNLPLYLAALLLRDLRPELKKGAITGVMAPFLVPCLRLYGGWQLRPVFPCPTLPQACLSVCLHTKFGSGPCLGAAPAG